MPSAPEIFEELDRLAPDAAAARVTELLEGRSLDGSTDERGIPLRVLLTRRMLALGWPYALSIEPADLQALRSHMYALSTETWSARACVFAAAIVAAAWCFVMTGAFYVSDQWVGAAAFFFGVVLAACALVAAGTWRQDVAERLFAAGGSRWTLLTLALMQGYTGYVVGAIPSFVLGVCCVWATRALRRKSERAAALLLHTPAR